MPRKTIKVFINNIPFTIINYGKSIFNDESSKVFLQFHNQITEPADFINRNYKSGKIKNVFYFCRNVDKYFEEFCKDYKYLEAAGGVVFNDKNEVLMIHRLGYWDLPKGKIDKGEEPKETAIREIEEECGIGKLKIKKELPSTYHTYVLDRKNILKKTYWFKMTTSDTNTPIPQAEEHIDKVCWMNKTDLEKLNSTNTYPSILEVLSHFKDINSLWKK